MGLFERFPYTNFHELNATWMIEELVKLKTTIEQFVSINALKYADPIQWNITSQYEKNTIVIDPQTGTAYISVQPVPSGVAITNTDYWTVVFDLGSFVVRAAKNFTDKWEDESTLTATFPSSVNDWLIWGDTLYRVISPIIAGDQYVIDSNIKHFTMEDILGHIQDLNTTDKSNIVNAINEIVTNIEALNLKASIVFNTVSDLLNYDLDAGSVAITAGYYSINDGGDAIYQISDNAINAASLLMNNGKYATIINPTNLKQFGAYGDNTHDDSTALNIALSVTKELYIPKGVYLISTGVTINTNGLHIYGYSDTVVNTRSGSIFHYTGSGVLFTLDNVNGGIIENLCILGDGVQDYTNTTGTAFNLLSSYNLKFSNIIIFCIGYGFTMDYSWDTKLERVKVYYTDICVDAVNHSTNLVFDNTTLYRSNIGVILTDTTSNMYDIYFDSVKTGIKILGTSHFNAYTVKNENFTGLNDFVTIHKAGDNAYGVVNGLEVLDDSGTHKVVKVDTAAGTKFNKSVIINNFDCNNNFTFDLAGDTALGVIQVNTHRATSWYPAFNSKILINGAYPKNIHGKWINDKYRLYEGVHVFDHTSSSLYISGTDIQAELIMYSPLGVETVNAIKTGGSVYRDTQGTFFNVVSYSGGIEIAPGGSLQSGYGELRLRVITDGRIPDADNNEMH